MNLDVINWPELPHVGSRIEFHSGYSLLAGLGECVIVRADHVRNAAGRPGGRVILQTKGKDEYISVTLSQIREHSVLLEDGLAILEREKVINRAREHE